MSSIQHIFISVRPLILGTGPGTTQCPDVHWPGIFSCSCMAVNFFPNLHFGVNPNVSVISLPSLSGSLSITNLKYDNQSRTLTCTSTGGPATTVTWSRNGAVITLNTTYQQTKRVVDPVIGTYQTVLTIDPSVDIVGTYNCTVENARGVNSKLYPIDGSGELIIPYRHYLLRIWDTQLAHSSCNIKFNIIMQVHFEQPYYLFCRQNKCM